MQRGFLKFAAAMALAVLPAAANAAVTYVFTAETSLGFSGTNPATVTGSFEVTLPDYLTSDRTFSGPELVSCTTTASDGAASTCTTESFTVTNVDDSFPVETPSASTSDTTIRAREGFRP